MEIYFSTSYTVYKNLLAEKEFRQYLHNFDTKYVNLSFKNLQYFRFFDNFQYKQQGGINTHRKRRKNYNIP